MKHLTRYLWLQSKRTAKAYAGILALTLALLLAVGAIGLVILKTNENEESASKIRIGLVGGAKDEYLKAGLEFVRKSDASAMSIDFVRVKSVEAANELMAQKNITAYVIIPDNFGVSLMNGDNKKATFVMAQSGASVGTLLTKEVVDVISNYIVETQAGVTAMINYSKSQDLTKDEQYDLDMDMSMEYLNLVTGRDSFTRLVSVGLGTSLSTISYYICGLLIFFIMGIGLANCSLMVKTNRSLEKNLYAKGYGVITQILGEYLPFLISTTLTLLVIFGGVGVASKYISIPVAEFKYFLPSDFAMLAIKLLPAIALLTAMQFLLYEAVSGVINSVLLQFVVAVVMGYISGCFYPSSFFPESVQKFSLLLPTGVAKEYFGNLLLGVGQGAWQCVWYALALLLIAGVLRKLQISATEGQ